MNFLFVALGGALGAMLRYAISLIPARETFPILTLITNILGAIAIGFIVGLVSSKNEASAKTVLFWKTGFCGGFTTFSTFSLETLQLFQKKQYGFGGLYIALSCAACIFGVWAGERLAGFVNA